MGFSNKGAPAVGMKEQKSLVDSAAIDPAAKVFDKSQTKAG
jgi:hypothetical protein